MFSRETDPRLQDLDEATAAFAMLSTHEFIIEVLLANMLAPMSPAVAQGVVNALSDRWSRAYSTSVVADPAHAERHLEACQGFVERLLKKAQQRAYDLREHRRPEQTA